MKVLILGVFLFCGLGAQAAERLQLGDRVLTICGGYSLVLKADRRTYIFTSATGSTWPAEHTITGAEGDQFKLSFDADTYLLIENQGIMPVPGGPKVSRYSAVMVQFNQIDDRLTCVDP